MAQLKTIAAYRSILDKQAEAIGALTDALSSEAAFIKREDFANGSRLFTPPALRDQRRAMLLAAADRCRVAADSIPSD